MRFDGLPLRTLIFLLIALSCPILALAAPVSRETIERLAEMNVERGEIRHLNAIGKLTDKEYYARLKTIDSEGATLWEPHNQTFEITREELRQAQDTITGLTRAKLSLLEPRWEKEQTEFQEARRRQKEQIGIELEKDTRTAADFQRQRLLLQRQLDKGAIDRDSFTVKDKEAQNGIAALRKKFEVAGGSYPRRFDERLTLLTKALADNPDTVLPRSQVPATVEGKGTGRGVDPDFNSDVKLAAELLANSEEISWKFEKKQVSSDTFRETAKVYSHDLSRLRARYDAIKRGDQFEAAYTRLAAPAIQAIRVKYQPEKSRQTAPTTTTQRPPPPPDFTLYYWLGGGGLLLVIFWLASLGKKEEAPAGPTPTGIHGTAAWSDCEYMTTAWDTVARGVHFGQSSSPQYRNAANHPATAPITSRPENHTLIVARTRAGKGTGVIIPTLLRCQDSMLIIDPKGENAAITARIRRDQLRHQIHIINPWDQLTHIYKKLGFETATFNPLDAIDREDPNAVALAQSMAGIICPPPQGKENPYWQGSAANILSSVFLWLAETLGEKNTLLRAHEIVTQTRADFIKDLAKMASSTAFKGAIKRGVSQYLDLAPETYSNIISTLGENTKFLLDSQITASTETSSFSMKDLRDKYLTVYLVIPHDYIKIHSKWLRLIIAAAMQSLKSRNRLPNPPHHRCMFLIDEFGSMGHMPDMPTDIAVMSGFGLDFTLVLQNLGQLQKNYGEDSKTILSNCGYQWFCYIKELETAKYLSECLGKKTVVTVGTGKTIGATQAGQTEGSSTTYGETGRSLLNPDEVLNLGQKVAILMHPYGLPHYLRPVAYSKLTETYAQFKNLCAHFYWNPPLDYDRNPYVKNSGKPPDPPPPSGMPTVKKEASAPPFTPAFQIPNLPKNLSQKEIEDIFSIPEKKFPWLPKIPAQPAPPPPPKEQPKNPLIRPEGIPPEEWFRDLFEGMKPPKTPPPTPPPSKPKGIDWEAVFPEDDPTQPPPKPPPPPEPPKPPKVTPGTLGEDVFDEDDEWQPPDDPHDPDCPHHDDDDDDDDPPDPGEPQAAQGR